MLPSDSIQTLLQEFAEAAGSDDVDFVVRYEETDTATAFVSDLEGVGFSCCLSVSLFASRLSLSVRLFTPRLSLSDCSLHVCLCLFDWSLHDCLCLTVRSTSVSV